MKNMGYVTPFNVMLIALLSMQFATSNGTLICFVSKYAPCYQTIVDGAAQQQCRADEAIQCLDKSANECDINNSTNAAAMEKVLNIEQLLADLCKTGSDMNTAFLKHRECIFGKDLAQANVLCYQKLVEAISKYKPTGNTEKDTKAVFKLACKYSDDIKKCVSGKVKEICGEDALSFQRKLSDPPSKLEEMACNSSPAPFGSFWTVLLQASVLLMSLQYFKLKG